MSVFMILQGLTVHVVRRARLCHCLVMVLSPLDAASSPWAQTHPGKVALHDRCSEILEWFCFLLDKAACVRPKVWCCTTGLELAFMFNVAKLTWWEGEFDFKWKSKHAMYVKFSSYDNIHNNIYIQFYPNETITK